MGHAFQGCVFFSQSHGGRSRGRIKLVPYRCSDSHRLAFVDNILVVLDVHKDRYSLISGCTLEEFNFMWNAHQQSESELVTALIEIRAVKWCEDVKYETVAEFRPDGYFEPRGYAIKYKKRLGFTPLIIGAIYILIALFVTNILGMSAIPRFTAKQSRFCRLFSGRYDAWTANDAVRTSMMIVGMRGKCLTLSLAMYFMSAKKHNDIRLVVGVRAQPFYSHAWLEVNGLVVNDDTELRRKMAVIMEL